MNGLISGGHGHGIIDSINTTNHPSSHTSSVVNSSMSGMNYHGLSNDGLGDLGAVPSSSGYQVDDFLNVPVDYANLLEKEMEDILSGGLVGLSSSSLLGGGGMDGGVMGGFGNGVGGSVAPGGSRPGTDNGFLMRLDTPAPDELPNLDSFDPLNFGVSLDGSEFESKYAGLLGAKLGDSDPAFSQFASSTSMHQPLQSQFSPFLPSDFLLSSNQQENHPAQSQQQKLLHRPERTSTLADRTVYMTSPLSSFMFDSSHQMSSITAGGSLNDDLSLMVDPQTGIPNRPLNENPPSTTASVRNVAGPVGHLPNLTSPVSGINVNNCIPSQSSSAMQQCDRDVHMMSPPPISTTQGNSIASKTNLTTSIRLPAIVKQEQSWPLQQGLQGQLGQQPMQQVLQINPLSTNQSANPSSTVEQTSSVRVSAASDSNGPPQAWTQLQTILLSGSNGTLPPGLLQQLQPFLAQQKAKNFIVQAKALTPLTGNVDSSATPSSASAPLSTPSFQTVQILKSGLAGAIPGAGGGGKTFVIRQNSDAGQPPTVSETTAGLLTSNSSAMSSANMSAAVISQPTSSVPGNTHQLFQRQLLLQQPANASDGSPTTYQSSSSDVGVAGGGSGGSVSSENSDEDFPPAEAVPAAAPAAATGSTAATENPFPKPVYSYSCLIALSLKNSKTGSLPVNEIYSFMTENFPYFRTAPDGWKNSVRHNLSLNKCFEKIEKPGANGQSSRKGCFWSLNPDKLGKMEEEIIKWRKKDQQGVLRSMSYPDQLEVIEKGNITSSNYMQFSHFRDRRLLFQDLASESAELSSSPSGGATSSTPAQQQQQPATVIYPSAVGKQMVKMSDLGTALQKETITIKREENGEMIASVMTTAKPRPSIGGVEAAIVSNAGASGNFTGTITTGNILASLGGLPGATSIKFSFTPNTEATNNGVAGGLHNQPTLTTLPVAKVLSM